MTIPVISFNKQVRTDLENKYGITRDTLIKDVQKLMNKEDYETWVNAFKYPNRIVLRVIDGGVL